MMRFRLSRSAAAALFFLLSFSLSYAQTPTSLGTAYGTTTPPIPGLALPSANAPITLPPQLQNCSVFYKFGSTPISLTPVTSTVTPGHAAQFIGTVKNSNAYPLTDVTVYAKIFSLGTTTGKNLYGPDVVDWFPVKSHIVLPAGSSTPLTASWSVPTELPGGSYQIALYVVDQDRFEYQGLTFTDDVPGMTSSFTVDAPAAGDIAFEKTSTMVGDQPFYFAAYPPHVDATSTVSVSSVVSNTTNQDFSGPITWTLYYWDNLSNRTELAQHTETLSIPAGGTRTVSYTVSDTKHTVYYLQGVMTTPNAGKSVLGVRFVRINGSEPRFNAIGVSGYPVPEGGAAFACFHSTSEKPNSEVTVKITARRTGIFGLLDRVRPFASAEYHGIAPSQLSALALPFTKGSGSFIISAALYDHGVPADSLTLNYSCTVTGTHCSFLENPYVLYAVILLIAIAILLGGFMVWRKRRIPNTPNYVAPS